MRYGFATFASNASTNTHATPIVSSQSRAIRHLRGSLFTEPEEGLEPTT